MQSADLIGLPVDVTISEPWEFETQVGSSLLSGYVHVVEVEPNELLVNLDEQVVFEGQSICALRAAPRYEGDSVLSLRDRRNLVCNFEPVTAESAGDRNGGRFSHLIGALHVRH